MGTVMYENCPDEPHYDGATDGSVDVHLWIFPVSLVSLNQEIELRKERKTKSGVLLPLSLLFLYRN